MARSRSRLTIAVVAAATVAAAGCKPKPPDAATAPSRYLFAWAGPKGGRTASGANDFVAVIDADPSSGSYGRALAVQQTGTPGAVPHHTELMMPAGRSLFASDVGTGQLFLLDFGDALEPKVATRIDAVPGFRQPQSFARLRNNHVLTTLQFGDRSVAGDPGGLAEFDVGGKLLRSRSAADPEFPGARIRPNGIEVLPSIDRVVTTSMAADDEGAADVIQVWRLSELKLLHTVKVPPMPGGARGVLPSGARMLRDGRTLMLNSHHCGFYHVSDVESDHPKVELVHSLTEKNADGCGVTILGGRFWIVPVARAHAVIAFDVGDPAHPKEVSRLTTDSTVTPSWLSPDRASDRIVIGGGDEGEARLLVAHVDRTTGKLAWDERFRDAGSARLGVSIDRPEWRHGAAHVMGQAAVFGPVVTGR